MDSVDHLKILIMLHNPLSTIPMEISFHTLHQCNNFNPINTSPTPLKINFFLLRIFKNQTKPITETTLTLHKDPTQIKTSNVSVVEKWDVYPKNPRIPFQSSNVAFEALFDTGATKSIMNKELFYTIDPTRTSISPDVAVDLFDVNDRQLRTLGTATLKITHGDESIVQKFIITDGTCEPCI